MARPNVVERDLASRYIAACLLEANWQAKGSPRHEATEIAAFAIQTEGLGSYLNVAYHKNCHRFKTMVSFILDESKGWQSSAKHFTADLIGLRNLLPLLLTRSFANGINKDAGSIGSSIKISRCPAGIPYFESVGPNPCYRQLYLAASRRSANYLSIGNH